MNWSRVEFAQEFDGYDAFKGDDIVEWKAVHLRRVHTAIDAPLKAAADAIS